MGLEAREKGEGKKENSSAPTITFTLRRSEAVAQRKKKPKSSIKEMKKESKRESLGILCCSISEPAVSIISLIKGKRQIMTKIIEAEAPMKDQLQPLPARDTNKIQKRSWSIGFP